MIFHVPPSNSIIAHSKNCQSTKKLKQSKSMDVQNMKANEMIEMSLNQTEKSIDVLREGDMCRRLTSLELRDMHLSCHEDFQRLRQMIDTLEEQIHQESHSNSKWIDKRILGAKALADQALSSTLMVKDIQMLEKKVNILKESVIQLNKAYYTYAKDVDMNDLMQQVKDMVTRTQIMEKRALAGTSMDEKAIEKGFRNAMESLYGIQSTNPKLIEESKKLADEMRIFRDAASNQNFYKMIGKPVTSTESSASSFSASSSESSLFSSQSKSSSSSIQSAPSSTLFS